MDPPSASEAEATQALYERYAGQIFGYCLHQLGSREEAEDAVQTTFMNAFRGLRRGIVPEVESAWLFKIAHNVCLSRRRSSWRRGRVEAPNDLQVLQEVVPARERIQDDLIGLQDALDQMPEAQRRAILLREWQGLSYREISEELELSQAAVETLIFRARRTLANGLEQPARAGMAVRRARRGADVGSVLLWLKALFGGGGTAAVKVATAVVAVAATTTAVAEKPFHHAKPPAHKSPPRATKVAPSPAAKPTARASNSAQRRVPAVTRVVPAVAERRRRTASVHAPRGDGQPVLADPQASQPAASPRPEAEATSAPPAPVAQPPAAPSEPRPAKGGDHDGEHHGSSGAKATPAPGATSDNDNAEKAASSGRSDRGGDDGDRERDSGSSSGRGGDDEDGGDRAKTPSPVAVTEPTNPTPPVTPPDEERDGEHGDDSGGHGGDGGHHSDD